MQFVSLRRCLEFLEPLPHCLPAGRWIGAETVRQAVNRLEEGGYIQYDDGLFVTDERVREAARELPVTSARMSPPSIEEAYVIPQFGDWPFAFARIDAVY